MTLYIILHVNPNCKTLVWTAYMMITICLHLPGLVHLAITLSLCSINSLEQLTEHRNILSPSFQVYYQFSSVTQLCPTLCDPMNCSTPGLPVHHQLLESTQTHVHRVGDAIQSSLPPSSPSPPAFNLSQHQGLFK